MSYSRNCALRFEQDGQSSALAAAAIAVAGIEPEVGIVELGVLEGDRRPGLAGDQLAGRGVHRAAGVESIASKRPAAT